MKRTRESLRLRIIGCRNITYHRSRYSSLAAVLGSKTPRSAALFRTRAHALHSLSAQGTTGGSEVPAYDRCYILATDIYIIVFRAVPIRGYYAVPIAHPKPFCR